MRLTHTCSATSCGNTRVSAAKHLRGAMIRTYKPKVARAEEDFDQDPIHLSERKGTACEEPKSCVEAFVVLALAHGQLGAIQT